MDGGGGGGRGALSWWWCLCGVVGFSLFLLVNLVYLLYPTWKLRHVPCPPYLWGIGHLPLMVKEQAQVFVRLAQQYGPIYRFHVGRQPLVILADGELCRQLGIKHFKVASNRSIPAFIECAQVHKDGLFFSKDSQWTGMRNILLPLFHSEQMESFFPLLARILDNLTKNLSCCCSRDKDVNISDLLHKFALDVIGESAFGTRFNLLEDDKISHLKHGGYHDLAAAVTPTPGTVVNPDQELVNQAVKSLDALRMDSGAPASTIAGILYPILQHPLRFFLTKIPGTADWVQETSNRKLVERLNDLQARRKREVDDDDDHHKITRIDALSLLLTACQANAASRNLLQDNFVSGLTYELLLAGSETTATTLSFAIYNISGSERVEEKLLQEIDAYGPIDSKIGLEDLDKKFPYVEQVLKETMRMYTTTPVVARELSEQLEIGGYLLPKGTAIWMAMIAIFKDPKNFPEPEEFRPERFDPDSEENRNRPAYSYFPFGIGPRTCIGYKFAMMEAKMALIQIYRHFRLCRSPLMEHPLALQFGMIVRPKNGVIVHVQHRQTDSPEQSQIHL